MAVPAVMVAGRRVRVLVSREAQATVFAFSSGTQCAAPVRFVSSAASQTDDHGSTGSDVNLNRLSCCSCAESDGSTLDASLEVCCGNPAFRGGGDGAVDALEEHHSSAYGATHYGAIEATVPSVSELTQPCTSVNADTESNVTSTEDKAAKRRARDAERKRLKRAVDAELHQREAASIRKKRAADAELREREAASKRQRRAATAAPSSSEVRKKRTIAKRQQRAANPELRQREATAVRKKRAANPELRQR
ncbi:uncharacterized protein LOC144142376 isoform X3 [Haemaphysalis longicornis]